MMSEQLAIHARSSRSLGSSTINPSHDVEKPMPPESTRIQRSQMLRIWWLEISACVIAFISVSAIVVTLLPYQGKPIPQLPYKLSMNTLVSIYMTILKACIATIVAEGLGQMKWRWFSTSSSKPLLDLGVFDAATRGPLGASKLLLRLRFTTDRISSLGAIIALIVLAIDPFAQQVVNYHECVVSVPGARATIPRSNYLRHRPAEANTTASKWLSPGLQGVVQRGVFAPSDNDGLRFECGTGNCSFTEEYSSVAICSSCVDVTKNLQITGIPPPYNRSRYLSANETVDPQLVTWLLRSFHKMWNSLPSGFGLEAGAGPLFNLAAMNITPAHDWPDAYDVEIIIGKQPKLFEPVTGNASKGCSGHPEGGDWRCNGYGAARCSLHPCVQTYKAEIKAGVLTEDVFADKANEATYQSGDCWPSTAPGLPTDQRSIGLVDKTCLTSSELEELCNISNEISASNGRWLLFNTNATAQSDQARAFGDAMFAHHCLYAMDSAFVKELWDVYLPNFFQGNVSGSSPGNDEDIGDFVGSDVLKVIYNYGDTGFDRIEEIFGDIAASMTKFMREDTAVPRVRGFDAPANGTVLRTQTCLHVQWGWFACPTVLMLLTLVFFISVLAQNRQHNNTLGANAGGRVPAWKSSPLPLLLHDNMQPSKDLGSEGEESLPHLVDFQRRASQMRLRLGGGTGGVFELEEGHREAG